MQLHTLKKVSAEKNAKRIGRGGKRGTTSGRGQKGQKSRAGRRIRPAIRDLVQRIAKRRGFRNKPKSAKPFVVSLKALLAGIRPLENAGKVTVSRGTLLENSLIPKGYQGNVKILGDNEVKLVLNIRGVMVSQSVKEKVEKAGGTVRN
jgi:large subunit ribosomal protein L15